MPDCPEKLWEPHPKGRLDAALSSLGRGKVSLPMEGGRTPESLKVCTNPNHSMILFLEIPM